MQLLKYKCFEYFCTFVFAKKKCMQVNTKTQNIFSTEMLLNISDIIVKKFVKNGSINYNNFEEYKQAVIEKYLQKKDKIESGFTGKAKPETYISAVLYRITLEVLRSEKNREKKYKDTEDNSKVFDNDKVINPEERLIIENEKEYLKRVFLTLGKDRIKKILFVKFYFRLLIILSDMQGYVQKSKFKDILKLLHNNKNVKDKHIFFKLTEVQKICENKTVKQDAVRIFVKNSIKTIISRLNGQNRTFYTTESLQILFEMYFLR